MSVRTPDEFESRLRDYLLERGEEARAVRVGEKDKAEQAAIVERYADLFTIDQHSTLNDAWLAEAGIDERERLYRLRITCASGLIVARLASLQDALQNAELAAEVDLVSETVPLRTAMARMGTVSDYREREDVGTRAMDAAGELNDARRELRYEREQLRSELSGEPDPIRRSDLEKGLSLRQLAGVLAEASDRLSDEYAVLRSTWLDRLLGAERETVPSSYHASYAYRLSALADVYTKERSTDVCLSTLRDLGFDLANDHAIRLDLEDRPQKTPRAAVIPSDPPAVVHLVTRAQGGLQDYQGLLHEAGHALHFAGCDPSLPYTFRRLSRDNALTEVYSYTVQAIVREPAWHERYFDLSSEKRPKTPKPRASWIFSSSGGTSRSSTSSSSSGDDSRRTGEPPAATPSY